MTENARIAAYVRVSTGDQRLDVQRGELERYFQSHHIDLAGVRWFCDQESGATIRRPAFDQMQVAIRRGWIDTVVLWKLDRVSRRLRDGIGVIGNWLERGVRIVSVTQQLDFSGALGQTIAALLFGVAEIELEYMKQRQRAGIAAARARGVYRGRVPGSTKGKPDRVRELRDKGLRIREIAEALGISERTAQRYLAFKD